MSSRGFITYYLFKIQTQNKTMKEYRIEKVKVSQEKMYLPAQILGDKRILWETEPMSIADCKKTIAMKNKPKWEWVLLEVCA